MFKGRLGITAKMAAARLPLFCDGPGVEEVVLDRRTHQKIKGGDEYGSGRFRDWAG